LIWKKIRKLLKRKGVDASIILQREKNNKSLYLVAALAVLAASAASDLPDLLAMFMKKQSTILSSH
jgi:hypothetical protein